MTPGLRAFRSHVTFASVAALALLQGCINMSSLQTAETLKPGETRTIIGGGYYTSPEIEITKEDGSADATTEAVEDEVKDIKVPYGEIGVRYGAMPHLEIGAKLTLIGTIAIDAKYQLLDSGGLAVAAGGGVGYVTLESESGSGETAHKSKSRIIDVMVPAYVSYRLAPAFALYTSPKFVYRSISSTTTVGTEKESAEGGVPMAGMTLGTMVGSSWGMALEGTYMKAFEGDFAMMQVAAGVFF